MPVYDNTDPAIKSMQGLHAYYYFPSNCAQRVTCLQPWYAPLVCLMLRTRARLKRGGPSPAEPGLAARA